MIAAILVLTGGAAAAYAVWRGYVAARAAMLPLLRDGEPTRTLVDAGRPVHARARVRLAARQVLIALGWLTVALYGMYLASVGTAVRG